MKFMMKSFITFVVSSQDSGFRLEGLHRLHERDNHKV
jgi:hypothetical protein